jgi:hypothetical protein
LSLSGDILPVGAPFDMGNGILDRLVPANGKQQDGGFENHNGSGSAMMGRIVAEGLH